MAALNRSIRLVLAILYSCFSAHPLFAESDDASIPGLQREVGALSAQIKQFQDSRNHHGKDIAALQQQVTTLQGEVSELKAKLVDVNHDDLALVRYLKVIAWLVGILTTAVVGELIRRLMAQKLPQTSV